MQRKLLLLLATFVLGGISLLAVPAEGRNRRQDRRGDWDGGVRTPWVVIERHGFYETHRPPGWDRGRKTGWGACDLPPGQAKKAGCGWSYGIDRRRPPRGPVIVIELPW